MRSSSNVHRNYVDIYIQILDDHDGFVTAVLMTTFSVPNGDVGEIFWLVQVLIMRD